MNAPSRTSRTALAWTSQGAIAVTFALAAGTLGILRESTILLVFAGATIIALCIDGLLVGGRRPHAQLTCEPGRVPENGASEVKLNVKHPHTAEEYLLRLSPGLEMVKGDDRWFGRDLKTTKERTAEVRGIVRGPQEVGPLLVRRWSPLRIWCREFTDGNTTAVEVVPRSEDPAKFGLRSQALKPISGRFTVNRPGQGFEFFTLRQYQSGDTIRSINWKASARTEELVVNQVQRETSSEVAFLLDRRVFMGAGPIGKSPLDRACRVAISLYVEALSNRDRVHFLAYGDGISEPSLTQGGKVYALEGFLASLDAKGDASITQAWDTLRLRVKSRGPMIVFSSAEGDASLPDVLSDAVRRGHTVTLVSPCPGGPTWAADTERIAARQKVLDAARQTGAIVVDWIEDSMLVAETPARLGGLG